jgi:uncharacterized protein YjbI with pentapeptide repeats
MANPEHLKILKQGVEVWNQWREEHPDEEIDLREADLEGARLQEANLSRANLQKANMRRARLREANLQGVDLRQAALMEADLYRAKLEKANLWGTRLYKAILFEADLTGTTLQEATLQRASLVHTNLSQTNITGAKLYGTARNDWIIEGIQCDYLYWDEKPYFREEEEEEEKQWLVDHRTPKDRDFRPGEFENLYKQLPTFEYYFEHGFTPIDAVVMDRVVQAINERHPEFELNLSTLDSRGQPHAVFTVVHKDHLKEAQHQVTTDFEQRLAALEGKQEQMMELFARIADNPKTIELILGDKRMIQAGRDYLEQVEGDVTTGESASEPKKDP